MIAHYQQLLLFRNKSIDCQYNDGIANNIPDLIIAQQRVHHLRHKYIALINNFPISNSRVRKN